MSATCPKKNLLPIPGFPAYVSSPDGLDVWRVVPAKRGPTAGRQHRMRPAIHPRGLHWAYLLTDANGKQRRLPIPGLVELLLDTPPAVCDSCLAE
jgi:hypothetical protein